MSYRVDNITNINDVETQGQDSGEENCQADNGADRLSVMFPACQDPLLTKSIEVFLTAHASLFFFYKILKYLILSFKSPL